jgi:hypothetical protein
MAGSSAAGRALTFDDLPALLAKTEAVSRFLQGHLQGHLDTLRPLLAPARLLGRYAGGKDDAAGADKLVAQLKEQFAKAAPRPFNLQPELDSSALARVDPKVQIVPWEYAHEAKGEGEAKALAITSPVRWFLTYGGAHTPPQVRRALAGRDDRRSEALRQFVVDALLMRLGLERSPGIGRLLSDLRYEIAIEPQPGLGEVPLVTVRSIVPAFRPPDALVLAAVRFSGVPAFIELVDVEAVRTLEDPFRSRIQQLLA